MPLESIYWFLTAGCVGICLLIGRIVSSGSGRA